MRTFASAADRRSHNAVISMWRMTGLAVHGGPRLQCASMALVMITLVNASAYAQDLPRTAAHPASIRSTASTGRSIATLVYDARLRELWCWSEGALAQDFRAHLCDPAHGWHPVNANVYFVRGQSIKLVVANAVAEDIFTLDIKADDLAEPQVPISGALAELPKLQPIPAPPTVLAGIGAAFVAGSTPIRASAAYRLAVTADEKDFKAWVQTNIVDPLNAKEVLDLLAADLDSAIAHATAADALLADVNTLKTAVEGVNDAPATMDQWVTSVKALSGSIDQDSALRTRLVLQGITAAGASINSALAVSRSAPVQRALAIDPADLALFANALSTGLGDTPYAHIDGIEAGDRHFRSSDAAMQPLIEGLNNAIGGQDASSVLARTKGNLKVLADNGALIQLADTRRQLLQDVKTKLDAQRQSTTSGIYALQAAWTAVADSIVKKAAALNARAKSLPLAAPFDTLPVGQWFSSKTITLTVKQGQRIALFDVGGIADATRAGIAGGDTPTGKGTQVPATDLAAARVIQFPIYNLYRFKIGLGFVYSNAEDKAYRVDKVTTGSGSAAVTQQFIDQTRDRPYNLLASVNVMIFPWARHAFPWRPRYEGEPEPRFYTDFAAMFGFSVTSPNRDFLIGGAWFPRMSPVGIQAAWHIALRDYPPAGIDPGQPISDRVIGLKQRRIDGISGGLVFTTEFFNKVFAPIFKP